MALSLVSYVGGKGRQLNELLPLIPRTRCYVEAFGGGASVLLNRERSDIEVYNDLNGNLVNLFRVVKDREKFAQFERLVELTLWAKDEFAEALRVLYSGVEATDVTRAWAFYTIQNMGISGKLHRSVGNWSRATQGDGAPNVERWWKRLEKFDAIHRRLLGVQVDSQPAMECIKYWDSPETTFYLDPPYVLDTRKGAKYYDYEMEDEEHVELVDTILAVQGPVVLSGYEHPLYDRLVEAGWQVWRYPASASMTVSADEKPKRVEVVWRNPQAVDKAGQGLLF